MSNATSTIPPSDLRSPSPADTILRLANQLSPVATETLDLSMAAGRVLAQEIIADRDSPAVDVSAKDGYAVRLADVRPGVLPVIGSAGIGQPPIAQPLAAAVQIVTGAPVPVGAEAVLQREDVIEQPQSIALPPNLGARLGQDIRRQGENALAGSVVLQPGVEISPAIVGTCAAFGLAKVRVFRPVRVSLIVTGDELLDTGRQPHPWQLRDSNGPALAAMLAGVPWAQCVSIRHVPDDLPVTIRALEAAISESDIVLMTGGVSMGDHDLARAAITQIGAQILFHGLPVRPGKPMLGAIASTGQAILGLPGNPLSVLVTARRFAQIVLRRLAGFSIADPPTPCVPVDRPDTSHPEMWLYRPVQLAVSGRATILTTKSSGDVVSAAQADGFVEIAPNSVGQVLRPYYPWRP